MPFATCSSILSKIISSNFVNKEALWNPPELSGWLEQQDANNRKKWHKRFFVLKGSYLFCFLQSTSTTPEGVVPLEYAFLETSEESRDLEKFRYTIHINLHDAYEDYCTRYAYKLASGKQEIREAWFSALSHAVLPSRLLIRELKSCGRLEVLLSKRDAFHNAHKNKVSFFQPGRVVDEDDIVHSAVAHEGTAPDRPKPEIDARTPNVSAERWDGDEEQEEAEDLQTMVDKRYSGINAARSNSGFEINVPNILVQSASMDEPIHAYYNSSFVPDSASQQRWDVQEQQTEIESEAYRPSARVSFRRNAPQNDDRPLPENTTDRNRQYRPQEGRVMEDQEFSAHSRMPYTVRVSESIKKNPDFEEEDVISVWGSNSRIDYPEDFDNHSAQDFPGFQVKKRSMKDSGQDSLSGAFTSFQMESTPNMQFRNRSATEEIQSSPQLTQSELLQKKRQTIHSEFPLNEGRRLSRSGSGNSGHSNRPRRSKFQPYVPNDTAGLGGPSSRGTARASGMVHDITVLRSGASKHDRFAGDFQRELDHPRQSIPMCKHDVDVWKRRSLSPSNQERLSFEEELQCQLEKRRSRIEQQQELQR